MSSINDSIKSMGDIFSIWLNKPHRAAKQASVNVERYKRALLNNENAGWEICNFKKVKNEWIRK